MHRFGKTLTCLLLCATIFGARSDEESKTGDASKPIQIYNILYPPQVWNSTANPTTATSSSCDCHTDDWYIIESKQNEMVLDASKPNEVLLAEYTGIDQQFWRFEPTGRLGEYLVVNKHSGWALEVIRETRAVITSEKRGTPNQHWMWTSKNNLYNVGMVENLETDGDGNTLQVSYDGGSSRQMFELKEKTDK